MKFFIIEFLDLLLLSLFFVVLDFFKKFQNLDINIIVAYISLIAILYLIIKDINSLNKLNNKLNIGLNPTLLFICIYDITLIINILANVTVINIIHYVIVITFTSYYIYQNYKKNKFEKN